MSSEQHHEVTRKGQSEHQRKNYLLCISKEELVDLVVSSERIEKRARRELEKLTSEVISIRLELRRAEAKKA